MALEALVIRFSTMNEFALILDTIDPTVEMIKSIQAEISKAMPSASDTLSQVSSVTADVLASANVNIDSKAMISTPVDADALNILADIEGALETEAKAKLPEIPSDMLLQHSPGEQQYQERVAAATKRQQQQQEQEMLLEG
jgi:hypothetical protein